MTYTATLPRSDAALDSAGNTASREYFRFFGELARANVVNTELPSRVDALDVRVKALEAHPDGGAGSLRGAQSVQVDGVLSNGLAFVHLAGDTDVTPALSFYGALAGGDRGWQTFATTSFASHDNGDGTSSLDLADVTLTAGGDLKKYGFDAKGRLAHSDDAVLGDLSDVDDSAKADKRILTWNATSGKWEAKDNAGGLPPGGTIGQVLTKASATDGDANWQTPSGGGGSGLIASATVTGSASTTITITGLDLSSGSYRVEYYFLAATATDGYVKLYFNGDTTDANYTTVSLSGSAAVAGASTQAFPWGAYLYGNTTTSGEMRLMQDVDGHTSFVTHERERPAAIIIRENAGYWKTVANVTSLTFTAPVANGFAVGSMVKVYR